jgi:hypothetical protein
MTMDYGADGKMNGAEFAQLADDIIQDMREGLPDVAKGFVADAGRGAICLHFRDAEKAQDRRMGINYITPDKLPDHKYLTQLVKEYDPECELVIWATSGPVHIFRHLSFSELTR